MIFSFYVLLTFCYIIRPTWFKTFKPFLWILAVVIKFQLVKFQNRCNSWGKNKVSSSSPDKSCRMDQLKQVYSSKHKKIKVGERPNVWMIFEMLMAFKVTNNYRIFLDRSMGLSYLKMAGGSIQTNYFLT